MHGIDLNQESFQNTDNELLKEFNDGKEMECVDIQIESHRGNGNISGNENLMSNGQKHSRIKDYVEYKALGSMNVLKVKL